MTPEPNQTVPAPSRVSVLARLVPAMSYALLALGSALSALLFINVIQAMRNAESAGIAAVAGGMSEANVAIIVSLYLSLIVGLAGIIIGIVRWVSVTKTASPSGWLFLVMGLNGFVPMLTLWQAQSLLISVLVGLETGGISDVASTITILLMLTLGLAGVACLILLVGSVVPLPALFRAKRKWSPVVFLVIIELLTVGMTVAYHLRTYWLYQVRINERF